MAEFKELKRIYNIDIKGHQASVDRLKNINAEFKKQETTIASLLKQYKSVNDAIAKLATVQEQEAKATKNVSNAEAELNRQKKLAEQSILNKLRAEKLEYESKLKIAQAAKVEAQAEEAKLRASIAQEKELDRLIDREEKAAKSSAKSTAANLAQVTSVNESARAYKELYNIVRNAPTTPGTVVSFRGEQLNTDAAQKKLLGFKKVVDDFNRSLASDGTLIGEYSRGIVNAFDKLNLNDILKKNIGGARDELTALQKKTDELKDSYRKAQQEGSADLNKLEKEIHDNVIETYNLQKAVRNAETELRNIGGVGTQVTKSINEGFKSLKTNINQLAFSYIGFQAIFSGITRGVDTAAELADQTTNLEIELGKAKGEAGGLVDQLAKLDTRTKLTVLEDIANIAARAGVSEKNLVGVTESIDKIKIAFGKDFGDVETGTESLIKLINIFLGPGEVTGENLLKMGNAIRTLANESVASVPFLNDFAKRMAGLKGISDISLPAVLGLASGFEQFGQSAEVSSTALVKIIPKLANETEKFAKIAGVTQKEFSSLLQNNPAEALLKVSEGLVKGTGSLEEFASAFKDTELGVGRVESVIGVLGKNSDSFRKSIDSAGESFANTSNIATAFAAKNENLAATLDKVSKKFSDAANGKAFQTTIVLISSAILFLLNNLGAIIFLGTALSAVWAIQNAQLLLLRGSLLTYNLLIARNYALMAILTPIIRIYNGALFLLTTGYNLAAKAANFFGIAAKGASGPLGIVLALVTILGSALVGLSKTLANANAGLGENNEQLRIAKDIQKNAARAVADQQAALQGYAAIVKDTTISEATRLKALKDLIAINPAFSSALKGNKIDLEQLNIVLKEYNDSLQHKAELEAAQSLQSKEFGELVRLKTLKESLQVAKQLQKGFGDLSEEEQGAFSKIKTSVGRTALTSDLLNVKINDADYQEAFKDLDVQINAQGKVLDLTTSVLKSKYSDANNEIKKGNALIGASAAGATKPVEVDIENLKQQIKDLDDLIEKFKGSQADLNKMISERKKLQDALDKALGTNQSTKTYRGARIAGDDKDELTKIDAIRDLQLAEQKRRFLEGEQNEKEYLITINEINTDAINHKLSILKDGNAAEKKLRADLQLDRITNEIETNQKLFELDNKQFEIDLRNKKLIAETILEATLVDPELTNAGKIAAQQDYNNRLLQAQQQFNGQQTDLEKLYGIQSIENEQKRKEAIEAINRELLTLQRSVPEAQIKDIRDAGDKQITEYNIYFSRIRKSILDNTKITEKERKRQLDELEKSRQRTVLSAELAALTIEFKKVEDLYNKGLVSEKEYLEAKGKMEQAAANLSEVVLQQLDTFSKGIQGFIESLASLVGAGDLFQKEIGDTGISIGYVLAESYDIAKQALDNYYKAKEDSIEREKQYHLDALDREKEQVLAKAESADEEDSINRQYDAKKREIEKQAGERLKKQKIAELRIALATELASYAVAAAQNPLNGPTFGIAGITQFALFSALALAKYAVNAAAINSQSFAGGGQIKTLKNGKISETPNVPPLRNGDNLLIYAKPGEVILNEDQQRRAGGSAFFRRLGVPGFALGGPVPGGSLQPPVNPSSFLNPGNSSAASREELSSMMSVMIEMNATINGRIDRIEVVQDTRAAINAQAKVVKNDKIGSL